MSYSRDTFNDLVWDSDTSTYVAAPLVCDRDTTIDIPGTALDSNTLYNVKDQQTNILEIFKKIYDIGSIYIGTMEVCPLAALFGTWVKVSAGRVLQGADENHTAGEIIEPGLPNITGTISNDNCPPYHQNNTQFTGVFYTSGSVDSTTNSTETGSYNIPRDLKFDASRSSSIYGNSDTVQPAALVVNIWKRIA